jgi:hypothetical protein
MPKAIHARSFIATGLFFALFCVHCQNYGLRDKLENPGGFSSTPPITPPGAPRTLYAFITSVTSRGNMADFSVPGCAGTGIGKADCVCQNLASAAGFQGTYVAWLSTATNDMTCRLFGQAGSNCSLTSGSSWYNTQDQLLAVGTAELFSGNLRNPLQYTETRTLATGGTAIWSGTDGSGLAVNGGAASSTCNTWAANIMQTAAGGSLGSLTSSWTNGATPSCSASGNIYCFALP